MPSPEAGDAIRAWQRRLYEEDRAAVAAGGRPVEDARRADWIYLVPFPPHARVLLVEPDAAVLPRALGPLCDAVTVMASRADRIALLRDRLAEAEGSFQLVTGKIDGLVAVPDSSFDLVMLGDPFEDPRPALGQVHRVLSSGGLLALTVRNASGLVALLRRSRRQSGISLSRWCHELRRSGFETVSVHAPLPSAHGVPFVLLPADAPGPLTHFSRDLVPLLDTVSPEAKRAYALERLVVRLAAPLLGIRPLASIATQLLPGYIIVARRVGSSGRYRAFS